MANTVNGGSHSSIESLNGEFRKRKHTKPRVLECNYRLRQNNVRSIWRCFFIVNVFNTFTGSWVKLDGSFRNGNGAQHSPVISEDGAMEDLLAEAVEEQLSKQSSRYCRFQTAPGVMNWAKLGCGPISVHYVLTQRLILILFVLD